MRNREVKEFFVGDRVKYTETSKLGSTIYISYTIGTVSEVGEKIDVTWDTGAVCPLYDVSQLLLVENEFEDEESLTEEQLFEIDRASRKLAREAFSSHYALPQLGAKAHCMKMEVQKQIKDNLTSYIGKGKTTDLIKGICHLLDTFDANVLGLWDSPVICVAVTSSVSGRHLAQEIINHAGRDTLQWNSTGCLLIKNWEIQFVDVTNVQTFHIEGTHIVALFIAHEVIEAMCVEFAEDVLGQLHLPKKTDTICDLIGNIRARMCVTRKRMEDLN